jgi:hypothetical protein
MHVIHMHCMVTAKQIVVRLAQEDSNIVEAVRLETGYVSVSDVVRYILRQYAKEHGIDFSRTQVVRQRDGAKPAR